MRSYRPEIDQLYIRVLPWRQENVTWASELEQHIKQINSKVKAITEPDGIFMPLKTHFRKHRPQDSVGDFCFSDSQGYHFCEIERGIVQRNSLTQDLFEITFLTLEDQIFWMSVNYEAKNRIPDQDSRRLMFSKRLQIYSEIGPEYAARAMLEIQKTLEKAPFQDDMFSRWF